MKVSKPYAPPKRSRKPVKLRGKACDSGILFRDKILRPFLDNQFGIQCAHCGVYPLKREDGTYFRHDADHIQGKGAHHELSRDVHNFQYLCRDCHIEKTRVPQRSISAR